MPPRWLVVVIVVAWLLMTGLMLAWDLGPRLAPGEPNVFPYKIIDEAGASADSTGWTVTRDGRESYVANVDWFYDSDDDLFVSYCHLWCKAPTEPTHPGSVPAAHALRADTVLQVARSGRLARLDHQANYRLAWPGRADEGPVASYLLRGEPRGRILQARQEVLPISPVPLGDFRALVGRPGASYSAPVPVPLSARGVVLSPLHPLRLVRDLRPGQTWRAVVFDPLGLAAVLESLGPKGLAGGPPAEVPAGTWHEMDARLLPEPELVNFRDEDVPCQVLEARAGGGPVTLLRVWARPGDGVVLRQEARLWGETWNLTRRPIEGRMVPVNPATAERSP